MSNGERPAKPGFLDLPLSLKSVIALIVQTVVIGGTVWTVVDGYGDRIQAIEAVISNEHSFPWNRERDAVQAEINANSKSARRVDSKLDSIENRLRAVEVNLAVYSSQVNRALEKLPKGE